METEATILQKHKMNLAILASQRGYPAPNPRVGCAIFQGDDLVGIGHHDYAGGPHAEVNALAMAGDRAKGADVFVTLEPCAHHGRTPPCCDALIKARVARVFIACLDPNPIASGGIERLKAAGIKVETGFMSQEASQVNAVWLRAMELKRPVVTVKLAMTADHFVDTIERKGMRITGPESRQFVMKLRADHGVVVVGRGTVESDNPTLNVRGADPQDPLGETPFNLKNPVTRMVLDPRGQLDPGLRVFDTQYGPAWQVGVAYRDSVSDGQINLHGLLQELWNAGHTSILVEGGPETIRRFADTGLVDRVDLFVNPILLGDGVPAPMDCLNLSFLKVRETRIFGDDVYTSYWVDKS